VIFGESETRSWAAPSCSRVTGNPLLRSGGGGAEGGTIGEAGIDVVPLPLWSWLPEPLCMRLGPVEEEEECPLL